MVGPVQYLLYKSTVLALFGLYEILKLSLNPTHILKRPCKTSASRAVRRLALWADGSHQGS